MTNAAATGTARPLASRVERLQPSSTLAVSQRVKELRAEGRDVIGFGAGEPDFDTPQVVVDAAVEALRGGMTHYMPVPGSPEARGAIAAKLERENGIACTADDVVLTTGGKQALFLVCQALLEPGRTAVVPTPAWVSYRPMVELAGAEMIEVATSPDQGFVPDVEALEAAIDERTALLLINSPSNPCGTMIPPVRLAEIASMLERHPQVTIVSDEIYERLVFGAVEHASIGAIEAVAERTVTVNGLSKAFAMTGWRLGYACAPGGLAKVLSKIQSQMTSHVTSFTMPAVKVALEQTDAEVEHMRTTFARRAELIHGLVSDWPEVTCPAPTGAFYVFPDVSAHFGKRTPAGRSVGSAPELAAALLEEADVAVVPGDDFGACASGHIRLSFACSDEQIEEGCRRIRGVLASLA